ncbi:MAG: hypothetical protein HYV62_04270 [Candidatus Rokubacteria bacterium]|nr:hypothetical protein [Candidatus Rokubacteria bacterium]
MPAGAWSRVAVLLAIAVVVAAGACLFDGGDRVSEDLCLVLLTTSPGLLLGIPLALAGQLRPAPAGCYAGCSRDLPVPPPKG